MPFTVPRYLEAGESEIIESLMAVVHRDMLSALTYFYAADALPDFAVMTEGDASVFSYPLLVLGVERMTSRESESGEWLNQVLIVGAGIVVNGTSIKIVKAKARKYVRTFKAVIRSASAADLLPAASQYVDYVVDVDHQYLHHGTKETNFVQPVELSIQFTFGEK